MNSMMTSGIRKNVRTRTAVGATNSIPVPGLLVGPDPAREKLARGVVAGTGRPGRVSATGCLVLLSNRSSYGGDQLPAVRAAWMVACALAKALAGSLPKTAAWNSWFQGPVLSLNSAPYG